MAFRLNFQKQRSKVSLVPGLHVFFLLLSSGVNKRDAWIIMYWYLCVFVCVNARAHASMLAWHHTRWPKIDFGSSLTPCENATQSNTELFWLVEDIPQREGVISLPAMYILHSMPHVKLDWEGWPTHFTLSHRNPLTWFKGEYDTIEIKTFSSYIFCNSG